MANDNKTAQQFLPFTQMLALLMEQQEVNAAELTRRCKERTGWGSVANISLLRRGALQATREAIENISRGLGVAPDTFIEYRLMAARDSLDPNVAGFPAAVQTYMDGRKAKLW